MNILAFESSCDETAAAVVRDGRTVLSDVIASQADMHAVYGGVAEPGYRPIIRSGNTDIFGDEPGRKLRYA